MPEEATQRPNRAVAASEAGQEQYGFTRPSCGDERERQVE
jgi:hypothetical protein